MPTRPALRDRLSSLPVSIGQLTFGSFLLVLAIIVAITVTGVLAVRQLNATFGELQRLQQVNDVSDEIERLVAGLRLAARDPAALSGPRIAGASETTARLTQLLERARAESAGDQRDTISAIASRLSTYRDAFERVVVLASRRADLAASLTGLGQQLASAAAQAADPVAAAALLEFQTGVAASLLGRDTTGAAASAAQMRAVATSDPALRSAVNAFADGVAALASIEREIGDLDRDVLDADGRQIGQLTAALRDAGARTGAELSRGFAATLAATGARSVAMAAACILIGLSATIFLVRRTVRPLAEIATAIRALASGERDVAIPATGLRNEIGDIARAAEVFRQTRAEADAAHAEAVRALADQRQAEASYRKLFEDSVEGIYVTTPDGKIVNANPALARMMGYDSPWELIAGVNDISHSIYVDPQMRSEYQLRMERDGLVRDFEYRVRQRNGDIRWLSDSAAAIRDKTGAVVRYEGAVRDITDQKNAETALAESRHRLQQVIDTVPAVINVKDTDLRYVLMNRYMARIFDIEPGDAIGRTTSELMTRYGGAKSDENDRSVLETGRELGFYEEAYPDSTGTVRHWMAKKVPLAGADGRIENIVTVALDIGARKRSEQEMRAAKDSAEAAFRNLRDTQNSLIEAEKLAALGRLVAGVAHEVNNPIGISLTVASSLQRRCRLFAEEVLRGDLRRSSLNEFLQSSQEASSQLVGNLNRAAELVQSFKQVAVDRNYSDRRNFNLRDLTEQLITSLRPGLGKQNVALTVDYGPDIDMNSYPGPYGQVITNLFVNAVTHAFPGGQFGKIELRVRPLGEDQVEVFFADNGCGMTADVRRHAFDPFFTTRRDQGGTGLGLHIVYNIVTNRLGGRITLTSEPGQGSQIEIVLPRVAPLEQAAE